jgi:hypothetical protein
MSLRIVSWPKVSFKVCAVYVHQALAGIDEQSNRRASRLRSLVLSVSLLLFALPASGEPRSFKCEEPLPEFTLGPASNPSGAELAKLCACVWSKLPEGGWERQVSAKLRRGEDPGWRLKGFGPRFGAAIDACGGRRL